MSDWDSRPDRLRIEGVEGLTDTRVVRLSWFDTMPAGRLTAISADCHRVDLLTVPPHTDENAAWAAMKQAAQTGNLTHTLDIQAPITTPATQTPRTRTETAQQESVACRYPLGGIP